MTILELPPRREAGSALLAVVLAAFPVMGQQAFDLDAVSLDSLLAVRVSAAARYQQTAAQAPASVTIVTGEDIRRFGYESLEELLASVRGFHTSNDRNYTYVGVRGFGRPTDYNNRLLLLVDGHALNDGFYGGAPVGTDLGIDLRNLDRVEIVRGPGSALFGASAMFAVVNLITRTPPATPSGLVRAEVGNFGTQRVGARFGGEVGGGVGIVASGGWTRSDGEDLYFPEYDGLEGGDGVARGADDDDVRHASARLTWNGLTLSGRTSSRWKGIPTGAYESNLGDSRARTRDAWSFVELAWTPPVTGPRRLDLQAAVDLYQYEGFYPYDESVFEDRNDVRRWLLDGQLTWDLTPGNRLVLGGGFRRHTRASYWAGDEDEVDFDGDYPYSLSSAYLQDEHALAPDLVALAGVRYDRSSLGHHRWSPRGALMYGSLEATTIKLLYGEAFRVPSLYELYFRDEFTRPSGGLEPEIVRTTELVVERRLGPAAHGTLALFDSRVRGLVDTTEDDDRLHRFVNRDRVSTTGAEVELHVRASGGSMARLSYALTRVTLEGGEWTNAPEHVVRGAVGAPLVGPLFAALEARHESGRITLDGSRTDPVFVTDLHLSTQASRAGISGWIRVANLFDAEYAVPGGFEHLQASILQPRRRLRAGMEYRF